MAGYFTDFAGETAGIAPVDWSLLFGTGRTITTVDNSANGHGLCLQVSATGTPGDPAAVKWDVLDADATTDYYEVLALVRDLDGYPQVFTRGQSNITGLVAGQSTPDGIYQKAYSAGTPTTHTSNTAIYEGTGWVWIRARIGYDTPASSTARLKVWAEGTEEPFAWQLRYGEFTVTAAGAIGFFLDAGRNSTLEVARFSVNTGDQCGTARSHLNSAAMPLCQFLLDEASSGTTPVTAADNTGNGNDLTLNYSGGDLVWTSVAAGSGLDFLAAPATSDSAIARLDDIANNGNLGVVLDGANTFWFAMAFANIAGSFLGSRLFAIGTSSGNTDVSIVKDGTDKWVIRFDQESGGSNHQVNFNFDPEDTEPHTFVAQIDMNELGGYSRIRLAVDGRFTDPASSNFASTDNLGRINNTNRILSLGNRGSLNRNAQGQIFYAEMGTGVLSEEQLNSIHSDLIADNDSPWLVEVGPATSDILSVSEAGDSWMARCQSSTHLQSLASASDSHNVIASVAALVVSLAQASDSAGDAPSATVSMGWVASGNDTVDAITNAAAALLAGAAGGESWTVQAQVLGTILEQGAAADLIQRQTESALNATMAEGSAASDQFVSAISAIAAVSDTATVSDAYLATVAQLASMASGAIASGSFRVLSGEQRSKTDGAAAGDQFSMTLGYTSALQSGAVSSVAWALMVTITTALSEVCTADDLVQARARVTARVSAGAVATARFAIVNAGVRYLVMGSIILRDALNYRVNTKPALNQSVKIKPGH